ncbi:hypothetical protein QVD17_08851 [Tagetes erecta]|uniref:Uncharacterized protein n=1 Tax=Tagetes erecta TaxID=13708 RepID=A0AAD8KZW2_TARER|nr:hypothetical protein QVD17_08851 [Tagetes erecta]
MKVSSLPTPVPHLLLFFTIHLFHKIYKSKIAFDDRPDLFRLIVTFIYLFRLAAFILLTGFMFRFKSASLLYLSSNPLQGWDEDRHAYRKGATTSDAALPPKVRRNLSKGDGVSLGLNLLVSSPQTLSYSYQNQVDPSASCPEYGLGKGGGGEPAVNHVDPLAIL